MTKQPNVQESTSLSEQELVLSTLEPDQLAEAKKQRVPRRHLKGVNCWSSGFSGSTSCS